MAAKTFSEILKGNPYHDERGRFTTGPKAKNPMIRTDPPPKKTKIAYKVFLAKDGKLYPPMVANPDGMDTPVGVWLDASEGKLATDKNGNPITNTLGRKKVKSGGKGTQGGSGTLAYRPGWHLGELPEAKQFYTKDKETGEKKQKKNFVWAECEIAADHNYQEEAMSYGYNKNGKFQHSLAGLPKIPKDGYYTYRTNPDPSTQPWYITGSMKVNRILTDRETNAILRSHGIEPMKRDGGELNLKALGFTETNFNKSANGDEAFSIFKTDDDKRLVFGWASVSITVDGEQLEDRQKDIIDPEDLEEAAYEYVLNFRDTGEEHISSMRKKGKLVESCVFTAEKQKAIGIPEGILPIGWWIGFKIEDDAAWQRVKNGTYKMFSIEGKANREPVEKSQPKGCGVLVVQDGKILTGTRIERGGKGKICGPGGHIEAGETPEEAAKREAMEEFGITCEELTPLGTLGDGSSAIFLCTEFSGTPETDEEEMTEPEWRTIEELGELELFGPFEASLEKLSPAKRHSVAKTFSEILKGNPYHDERGRFASAGAAGSGAAAGTAKEDIVKLAAKTAKNMSAYEEKDFVKKLTNAEGEAAAAYTEEIGFEMNKMARGQDIDEKHYDYDEVLDHALNFESALSKANLPQDAAVFRGASFDTAVESTGLSKQEIQADPQKLVGRTITERGFMSTSTDSELAEEYADGMVYHIKLPAGSQAVLQNSLNPYLDGPEITVNRNSNFKVLAAENNGGNTHVYMEYLSTGNSTPKSAPVAKTFSEVLKFNPYHDERGRFATANGYATFTIQTKDPKKQHWADMAMARMKQQAAANPPAPPKPAAPPKPQKNYDARGFADSDDADFHQLHSGRKYYAQQQLTTTELNAAANYLSANPEAGSLYSHCQNMNYKMATGQTLTGQYKKTHDGMMSAMHNMGYNVELTRYDHAGMVNGLLKTLGAGTDYERMSQSSLKKALVGQTLSENKFLSASYNDFKNAPNASVFTSRAVKINYKVKANAQAMMPGKGPGGDFGEIVLAPTNGKVNPPGKITDVRLTGQMMRRQGTQTYNQPRIEIDIEIG